MCCVAQEEFYKAWHEVTVPLRIELDSTNWYYILGPMLWTKSRHVSLTVCCSFGNGLFLLQECPIFTIRHSKWKRLNQCVQAKRRAVLLNRGPNSCVCVSASCVWDLKWPACFACTSLPPLPGFITSAVGPLKVLPSFHQQVGPCVNVNTMMGHIELISAVEHNPVLTLTSSLWVRGCFLIHNEFHASLLLGKWL